MILCQLSEAHLDLHWAWLSVLLKHWQFRKQTLWKWSLAFSRSFFWHLICQCFSLCSIFKTYDRFLTQHLALNCMLFFPVSSFSSVTQNKFSGKQWACLSPKWPSRCLGRHENSHLSVRVLRKDPMSAWEDVSSSPLTNTASDLPAVVALVVEEASSSEVGCFHMTLTGNSSGGKFFPARDSY